MESKIMVSILCATYNHEKYIRQCLEGFLQQKTDFQFEVIVHDDASTDGTAAIVREYEEKYPEIIKPIYQKENQYSKGISIDKTYMRPKVRGKYVAICEGDDFWISPLKLQKQVDALENTPSCHMSVHAVRLYSENGKPLDRTMPDPLDEKSCVINSRDFLLKIAEEYCYQTVSYFLRSEDYMKYWHEYPLFKQVSRTGDYPYMLYFAQLGAIYYIGEVLAGHRMEGVSSWTKNYISKRENVIPHWEKEVKMFEEYDKYTKEQYHDICVIAINRVTYEKSIRLGEYRELIKKKYRCFLKKASINMQRYIILCAIFPRLVPKLYKFIKEIKNDKS